MFLVALFDLLGRDRQKVTFAHTKYLLFAYFFFHQNFMNARGFERVFLCTSLKYIFFINLGCKRDNLAGFRIGYQNRKSNENALKCRVVKDNTARDSNMPRIKF